MGLGQSSEGGEYNIMSSNSGNVRQRIFASLRGETWAQEPIGMVRGVEYVVSSLFLCILISVGVCSSQLGADLPSVIASVIASVVPSGQESAVSSAIWDFLSTSSLELLETAAEK